jgi:hypothetical protein
LALRIEAQQVEDEGRETVFPLAEAENGNQWQLGENEPKPFYFIFFPFHSTLALYLFYPNPPSTLCFSIVVFV